MKGFIREAIIRGACLAAGVALVVSLPITLAYIEYINRDKK